MNNNDSNEFFVKEKWNQDDVKPFLGQISAQVYNKCKFQGKNKPGRYIQPSTVKCLMLFIKL